MWFLFSISLIDYPCCVIGDQPELTAESLVSNFTICLTIYEKIVDYLNFENISVKSKCYVCCNVAETIDGCIFIIAIISIYSC